MPKDGKKGKAPKKDKKVSDDTLIPIEQIPKEGTMLDPNYDPLAAIYSDITEYERVHALELENDTMKMIARELRLRLEKHTQSLTQIISHLNLEITRKEWKITGLEKAKDALQAENEDMQKRFAEEERQIRLNYDQQLEHMGEELKKKGEEERSLKHIADLKKKKEADLARLTEELERETREHITEVENMSRENLKEEAKFRRKMNEEIYEERARLLAMTEDQLYSKTRDAIIENDMRANELAGHSKETERLLKINNKLTTENRSLRRQTELNDQARHMLVRRSQKLQEAISNLNEQLAKKHKKRAMVKRSDNPEKDLEHSQRIMAALESRIQDLDSLIRRQEDDSAMLRAQLSDSREANTRMLGLQDESLTFVLMVFECMKPKVDEILKYDDEGQNRLPFLDPRGRNNVTGQPANFSAVHNKLMQVAQPSSMDNSSTAVIQTGSLAGSNSADFPKLTDFTTRSQRETFLDLLIKKLNTYSPNQVRLVTQHTT